MKTELIEIIKKQQEFYKLFYDPKLERKIMSLYLLTPKQQRELLNFKANGANDEIKYSK